MHEKSYWGSKFITEDQKHCYSTDLKVLQCFQRSSFESDIAIYEKLHRLAETHAATTMYEQFSLEAVDEFEKDKSESTRRTQRSLKMQVVTRWNSTLQILESLENLLECAMHQLKVIEKYELLLGEDEIILLHQLVKFLTPFKELTDSVSDVNNSLVVIPLITTTIKENCEVNTDDVPNIIAL